MPLKNTDKRFGTIAMLLHWIMAIIIIGLLIVGVYMVQLSFSARKLKLYGFHKEFGLLILALVIVRLCWRLINIMPSFPGSMPAWQLSIARLVHYIFYGLFFVLPLTGWMLSSASDLPVSFFGWFVMPNLVSPNEYLRDVLIQVHHIFGFIMIGCVLAHIAAVVQHQFILKDNLIRRMLP